MGLDSDISKYRERDLSMYINMLTCCLGEPVTFTVHVRPAENYPVDLYFLMDLSKTMQDDLGNLKSLAGNICKYMQFFKKYIVL